MHHKGGVEFVDCGATWGLPFRRSVGRGAVLEGKGGYEEKGVDWVVGVLALARFGGVRGGGDVARRIR